MSGAYDLAVVGAGIHGAGVAQSAAAAGQRVLLLEQYPTLAQGTSSRSSKLVHGGLRYLETAQFGLVRESLRERAWLLTAAPELVRLVPFHIPVYRGSLRPAGRRGSASASTRDSAASPGRRDSAGWTGGSGMTWTG